MSLFCSECLHYEGGPPKNGYFDEDAPVHDECNATENQESFTDYYGARMRPKQPPGKINEQNNCAWFERRSEHVPPS